MTEQQFQDVKFFIDKLTDEIQEGDFTGEVLEVKERFLHNINKMITFYF